MTSDSRIIVKENAVNQATAASLKSAALLAYDADDRELLMTHNDMETLTTFSELRHNLLDFYPFSAGKSLLSVNAGCGGMTALYLSRSLKVTTLSVSKEDAAVIEKRFGDKENLTIVAGCVSDLAKEEEKYDYIVVAGLYEAVLSEKEAVMQNGSKEVDEKSYLSMLKGLLNEGGRLFLAADNKYAMKYFAGMPDAVSGEYAGGPYSYGKKTSGYTREDLLKWIHDAGLKSAEVYYPLPDYRFPTEIYSEKRLPKVGSIQLGNYNYSEKRYRFFDESRAYDAVIEDGRFPDFASSYLFVLEEPKGINEESPVLKSTSDMISAISPGIGSLVGSFVHAVKVAANFDPNEPADTLSERASVLFARYSRLRRPDFAIGTVIYDKYDNKYVLKKALTKEAKEHIRNLHKAYELTQNIYKNIVPLKGEPMGEDAIIYPFLTGKSGRDLLNERIAESDGSIDALVNIIRELTDSFFAYNDEALCEFTNTDDFSRVFGTRLPEGLPAVKCADIDLIFDNIIFGDGKFYSFDYEWTFDFPIPTEFIRYRMLYRYYYSESERFKDVIGEAEFLEKLGFDETQRRLYAEMELSFQYYVYGVNCREVYTERYLKKTVDIPAIIEKEGGVDKAIESRDAIIRKQEEEYRALKDIYENVIHSKSYKAGAPIRALGNFLRKVKNRIMRLNKKNPIYVLTRLFINFVKFGPKAGIRHFKEEYSFDAAEIKESYFVLPDDVRQKQTDTVFPSMPVVSILVPLYNTPEVFLREMIASVLHQTYGRFELCLADGSDEAHGDVERIVKEYMDADARIRYEKLAENKGISGNTNACMAMATGELIALFDHDDLLTEDALFEVVKRFNEKPEADVVYTDEDKLVCNAKKNTRKFTEPNLKPDFNIDYLRSVNYICHLLVLRKSLVDRIGGFRSEYDGAQDYDFILRATENARAVEHVAKILYHWRIHEDSTAARPESKMYCYEAGRKAIEAHLERVNVPATVTSTKFPGYYSMKYAMPIRPLVSILIPNKDQKETLQLCIESILAHTSYDNYEIVVIENNSTGSEIFAYYEEIKKNDKIRVEVWEHEFNYSKINNFGAAKANGDYFLLLNNDIEVIEDEWLTEMLSVCMRDDVGAVGARLLYPDKTTQHGGVIVGLGGVAGHAFLGLTRENPGYFGRAMVKQDVTAVTAACLIVKRSVFEELGGLEERLRVAFNDIDFCLRIHTAGYRIVYNPDAVLYHYESKTRGYEDTPEKQARFASEVAFMKERWAGILEAGDPNYNRNLSLTNAYAVDLK